MNVRQILGFISDPDQIRDASDFQFKSSLQRNAGSKILASVVSIAIGIFSLIAAAAIERDFPLGAVVLRFNAIAVFALAIFSLTRARGYNHFFWRSSPTVVINTTDRSEYNPRYNQGYNQGPPNFHEFRDHTVGPFDFGASQGGSSGYPNPLRSNVSENGEGNRVFQDLRESSRESGFRFGAPRGGQTGPNKLRD